MDSEQILKKRQEIISECLECNLSEEQIERVLKKFDNNESRMVIDRTIIVCILENGLEEAVKSRK
jgi:hypothetical protein